MVGFSGVDDLGLIRYGRAMSLITPTQLERWAEVLVHHAVDLQPGQVVRISAQPAAEPLLKAVYRRVIDAGAHALVRMRPEFLGPMYFGRASDAQLDWVNPLVMAEAKLVDATINLSASTDLHAMDSVDPTRPQRAAKAGKASRELFFQRAAAGDDPALASDEVRPLLWSTTLFPTEAYAENAGMSLQEYAAFVVQACQLDQPDPVAFWRSLDAWQSQLAGRLMGGSTLHFQTPAGTDLVVDVVGMRWLSSPGRKNFPDGEVYSGPNLDAANGGAEGVVFFDKRCVYQGRAVRNVRITMEAGRATDVEAEEGGDFLRSMLDQDEGARRIGEVAFGCNRAVTRPTGMILFDEKMGGSFHLAFGAGYPETGNTNKSALHWDLIAGLGEGSRVTLDGEPFCVDGSFVGMPDEVEWLIS